VEDNYAAKDTAEVPCASFPVLIPPQRMTEKTNTAMCMFSRAGIGSYDGSSTGMASMAGGGHRGSSTSPTYGGGGCISKSQPAPALPLTP